MPRTTVKIWSMLLIAAISVAGIVSSSVQNSPAQAANATWFNPGQIISDNAFYNSRNMSVVEIQRFLDAKVEDCKADASRPGCLKNYRLSTPAVSGTAGRCSSLPPKTNITAAEIIYEVAIACGISPKVLLVKLQKEQGLVTATNPSPRAYEFALGMDCPDTPSGCSSASAGFFWQLYKGAGQLQWYSNPAGSFTWLKPGATISRPYQANNAACGSQSFVLENNATAALYYYTPYVPNQTALANLYGIGDVCSAYGNRNFFRDYTDWFGSTIGGSFLIKGEGKNTFLIVNESKFRIISPELLTSLSPLGPVGIVPKDHLQRFTTAGDMTGLARNAVTDRYFFIHNGSRLAFSNCEEVAAWGLNCANAVTLNASQVSVLERGEPMSTLAGKFIVENGTLRAAPTPSPSVSPSPSPSVSPSPSPSVSPSPSPSVSPSPSPSPTPTPTPDQFLTYTVVAGDSLSGIAARHGVTTKRLMKLNNIRNANFIRIGQVLKIRKISGAPTTPASVSGGNTTYTVVAGDSLSGIAARFGTTTLRLMNLNNITNTNFIRVGQVLIVSETSVGNSQPAPASTSDPSQTYTVVAGDSLSGISARFGTTTWNLMTLNGLTNANLIRVGQVLKLR